MNDDALVGLVQKAINTKVDEKYLIKNIIGVGSYGAVFIAKDIEAKAKVVVKIEYRRSRTDSFVNECAIYDRLGALDCIPKIFYYGSNELGNYIVMQHLGSNLRKLHNLCGKTFSLKTVLMITDALLVGIEEIHKRGIVHRDIKPDNIVVDLDPNCKKLYFIDFGLSKDCNIDTTVDGSTPRAVNGFKGSLNFCSLNAHKGMECSPWDDVESLGYVLIYLLTGKLPWSQVLAQKKTPRQLEQIVYRKKMRTSINLLCVGIPHEFAIFLSCIRSLKFMHCIDYSVLRLIFSNLLKSHVGNDGEGCNYDWCELAKSTAETSNTQS